MEAEEPNIITDTWLYFKFLSYFRIRKIVLIVFPDTSQWTFFQRWDKFSNECFGLKCCSAKRSVFTFLFLIGNSKFCNSACGGLDILWIVFLVGGMQQRWKFNLNPLKLFRKFCVDVLQYGSRIIIINCLLFTVVLRGREGLFRFYFLFANYFRDCTIFCTLWSCAQK